MKWKNNNHMINLDKYENRKIKNVLIEISKKIIKKSSVLKNKH